jgi:hypothetical protein
MFPWGGQDENLEILEFAEQNNRNPERREQIKENFRSLQSPSPSPWSSNILLSTGKRRWVRRLAGTDPSAQKCLGIVHVPTRQIEECNL